MGTIWSDLRLAFRSVRKAPGFSLAIVAALALGIGPNTAIFSIVYATLLAPLPHPQPEQLVRVWSQARGQRAGTSPAEFREWKRQATSFQYLEAFWPRQLNLATPDAPERVRARQVSPDGYRMFGDKVWLGRDFRADEDQPGKNQVAILSHRLWKRHGGDPGLVGREIRLDSKPYLVIGVLAPGIQDRRPADLWIPLSLTPEEIANRKFRPLMISGRLKSGVTPEQAQQEMNVITSRLAEQFPDSNTGWTASIQPLQNNFLGTEVVRNLWLLLAAVSFVVLIACVNVANLLLSRAASRRREIAIRVSLGATRGHLTQQALVESMVLAAAGGTVGVLSGVWILQGILALLPRLTLPSEADPRLSLPVLLYALATTVVSGLLAGSAQAWQVNRAQLNAVLKQHGRGAIGGRQSLRRALVIGQVALAVTLLAGAGLTIHSFWNRSRADLGVRTEHVLSFALPVDESRFSSAAEIDGFYRQVQERFRNVPGVEQASLGAPGLPMLDPGFPRQFSIVGRADESPASRPSVAIQLVTPEYFDTFGIGLVQGRGFTFRDGPGAERVAVINERFLERFVSGKQALGQRVVMDGIVPGSRAPGAPAQWQIVGVVRNVRTIDRFGDNRSAQIYLPFAQSPWPRPMVAVRSAVDPEALRRSLAAAVQAVDPDLPLTEVQTMDEIVGASMALGRVNIALYGGLATVALLLAALGIYGVTAFTVAQKTAEIGLRMALGADRARVRFQILTEGLALATAGLGLGLIGAYALGRAMQSVLYGTGPLSLPVFAATSLVLLGATGVACYLPARRASAVDPMIALRQE
jgi:putative ABC transport system permease protein